MEQDKRNALQQEKTDCQDKILQAILDFERNTGLSVCQVDYTVEKFTNKSKRFVTITVTL